MYIANGFIVQDKMSLSDDVKNFAYHGLCAFDSFPLAQINDVICRKLTREQFSREVAECEYVICEFITDYGLLKRYIRECIIRNIDVRILYVESEYEGEIFLGKVPKRTFIGYEYCTCPIDTQIITDLDWYEPFGKYHSMLNENGLFDSMDVLNKFIDEYNEEFNNGNIGDGEADAYCFKVYEIDVNEIL